MKTNKSVFGLNEDMTVWSHGSDKNMMKMTDGSPNGLRTMVEVRNTDTGELIFRGHNKTMLAGSEFMAMRMFKVKDPKFETPTYNTQVGIDDAVTNMDKCRSLDYYVQVFCIGTDGCNRESAIWYPVSNKKWIRPENLVPFRYTEQSKDLSEAERQIYFGRKTIEGKGAYAYYFKKFDSECVEKKEFADGTPWSASVYGDKSELIAQDVVVNTMSISKHDGRDYFIHTSNINEGRFNSIELCLAWSEMKDSHAVFQDVRPATRLNFPNKYFNDTNASWSITYNVYF